MTYLIRIVDPASVKHALRAVPGRFDRVRDRLELVAALARAGVEIPTNPVKAVRAVDALRTRGFTLPGFCGANANRTPDETAMIDDCGAISFAELETRTDAVASGLRQLGMGAGDRVALLAPNGRGFVEAVVGTAKIGADMLLLNTSMAPPQIADVLTRHTPSAIVYADNFKECVESATEGMDLIGIAVGTADRDANDPGVGESLESLAAADAGRRPPPPGRQGEIVILTSGTTGPPKGARRKRPDSFRVVASYIRAIRFKFGDPVLILPPLFHGLGYLHLELCAALGMRAVLMDGFDPVDALAVIERNRVKTVVAVPTMLRRILEVPSRRRNTFDTSSLSAVVSGGSTLPGETSARFMDAFGDILYDFYGTTETAWATVATPDDLRRTPGTVGKPLGGVDISVLDENDRVTCAGTIGRLFVKSDLIFAGYTGSGSTKDIVDSHMDTGDLGHFDESGRLFIDARADDMIVSGGENVYPGEVEECIRDRPDVVDVVAFGVLDRNFGEVLAAFVCAGPGSDIDADSIKDGVRRNLATFKVPKHVVFLDEIPRNATGKVVRKDLAELMKELV